MCKITLSIPDEALAALKISPEQRVPSCGWPRRSSYTNWAAFLPARQRSSQACHGWCSSRSLPTTV